MKRDLDLIRYLMLRIEECDHYNVYLSDLLEGSSYAPQLADYNIQLLAEAQYLQLFGFKNTPDNYKNWCIVRLTFTGHDYLDAIRDDNIWNETKSKLLDVGGTVSLEIVKLVAITAIKATLGLSACT